MLKGCDYIESLSLLITWSLYSRFNMWKALFRNFGDSFLDMIRPHVEAMVRDKRESHQRAASEVMAGLIRGSKHWDYQRVSDQSYFGNHTHKQTFHQIHAIL